MPELEDEGISIGWSISARTEEEGAQTVEIEVEDKHSQACRSRDVKCTHGDEGDQENGKKIDKT